MYEDAIKILSSLINDYVELESISIEEVGVININTSSHSIKRFSKSDEMLEWIEENLTSQ